MRIGIVGPISKDQIHLQTGAVSCHYGAAAYSATVLAKLLEGKDHHISCLTHLSPSSVAPVYELFRHMNISLTTTNSSDVSGTEIELRHTTKHDRISRQTSIMTPISPVELKMLSDYDYIILMPLNETDITPASVKEFRSTSKATIFLDIHGLITGVDKDGNRFKKNWNCPHEWLENIDILKMNDKEAMWASGRELNYREDYIRYAITVVEEGVSVCWITFGDQSSLVSWRQQEKLFWANVPVADIGPVVDTIGCGDSASAGFIYAYSRFHSPLIAVVMGNMLGSVKASLYEADEFPTSPQVRGMIYHHYRDYLHNLLEEFLSEEHILINEVEEAIHHESLMYSTNGNRHHYGTDHEGGGNSQSSSTPWP